MEKRQQLILKKSLYESVPKKVIKCEGITSESSTSGLVIANVAKVPGRDLEFYMMTWKNTECSDFEWVHYFAGKKP